MSDQITVWHPHLPGMTRQIPVEDLAAWLASGWLESAPSIPSQQGNPPRTPGVLERLAALEAQAGTVPGGVPGGAAGVRDNGDGTATIGGGVA